MRTTVASVCHRPTAADNLQPPPRPLTATTTTTTPTSSLCLRPFPIALPHGRFPLSAFRSVCVAFCRFSSLFVGSSEPRKSRNPGLAFPYASDPLCGDPRRSKAGESRFAHMRNNAIWPASSPFHAAPGMCIVGPLVARGIPDTRCPCHLSDCRTRLQSRSRRIVAINPPETCSSIRRVCPAALQCDTDCQTIWLTLPDEPVCERFLCLRT